MIKKQYIFGKPSLLFLLILLLVSCSTKKDLTDTPVPGSELTIAFGSCNKVDIENLLWDDILKSKPVLWIWGGDNIYADTEDVNEIRAMYEAQNNIKGYKKLKRKTQVIGTWDDHDYGLNDGGKEFVSKRGSQQAFLDFLEVPANHPRRLQEGIYHSYSYQGEMGSVKILVLDTRYFRTPLTPDTLTNKRISPNSYGQGELLGEKQWTWFSKELRSSKADFNIIISSIQFLSNEHGFECWGNFPHEIDRFKRLLVSSDAQGVFVLSGDRHISEFSKTEIPGLPYPLVDFTSSGLTHAYKDFKGEANPYRIGHVVFNESFGLVKLNFITREIQFQIIEDEGKIPLEIRQQY
ncbi:alkaline phosphatase D family protein [Eudoraea chungangensis]|uniref:alkaline phosphatase D family protein n=1 Tax=Eudoraea chungangensis TaxID=1481905 RepID=UPI0023EB2779